MKYPQLVSMPSAVSDWLEEQLEARGIDAVLYTRYVLSLLHSHTVDVIYPDDQDLQFSYLKKEVRRSTGGRSKRFRKSSSDWWRHAQADAEQIKRSAAVECLMSASDQNCEIESLVDELCEKLKGIDDESPSCSPATQETPISEVPKKITPQELAEKYYAAFPPLCPQEQQQSRLMQLMPRKRASTSPAKKWSGRKSTSSITRQGPGYEQKLYAKAETDTMKARSQTKQRYSYLNRSKNPSCRKIDWDSPAIKKSKSKFTKASLDSKSRSFEAPDDNDQSLEAWSSVVDDEMNMYEDLPVDIRELLDSPTPQDDEAVEMMNMANMRDDGKRQFIPYGTNIISSIWSTDRDAAYENTFNAAIECPDNTASLLNLKFSSISIDNSWPAYCAAEENEKNSYLENNQSWKKSSFLEGFHSLPGYWCENEDDGVVEEIFENQKQVAVSLMKLNHNKEKSCFTEIAPRSQAVPKDNNTYNPFNRKTSSMFSFNSKNLNFEKEKDDLLTSERSHFKPIMEKIENHLQVQYADGATFVISNNLNKVSYKRSESGSMVLENEMGQKKKYYEYKIEKTTSSPDLEFVLKFSICQNDKACQTDEESDSNSVVANEKEFKKAKAIVSPIGDPFTSSPVSPFAFQEHRCTCPPDTLLCTVTDLTAAQEYPCPMHPAGRPDSVLGEVVWKFEATRRCDKCDNNNDVGGGWNGGRFGGGSLMKRNGEDEWGTSTRLKDIWNGGQICQTCLNLNSSTSGYSGSCRRNSKLHEDISLDGEQLLSDLSHLQKAYMEELPVDEPSCDIQQLVITTGSNNERKRRHSFIMNGNGLNSEGSWSFASHLEEDCLIQMSTLPTLRSVTL